MARTPRDRYSTVAILLHWLIAAAIVFQILLAWRFYDRETPQAFALLQLHKSVGITILLLSLVRLGWRLANRPPQMPQGLATWEVWLSRLTHFGFYAVMIGLPLTGWIMVSASRTAIPTLLFGIVPWPHIPMIADLAPAAKKIWSGIGREGHEILAFGTYGLFALHVAGALKHQLFDRNQPVLARMAPGAKPGHGLDLRLLTILAAFAGLAAVGWTFQPRLPRSAPLPAAPVAVMPAPTVSVTAPAVAPEVAADPQVWRVSTGSQLAFATGWSGQAIEGRFDRWKADILFSPDALDRSKVRVVIDLASVNTGDEQRDAALPGSDFFDATSHPEAIFVANRFEATGPDRYIARGRLTLRGLTRPVNMAFRLKIVGDVAQMSAITTLDRTAFGVGQGEWQATDQIPAKVSVKVQLVARRN